MERKEGWEAKLPPAPYPIPHDADQSAARLADRYLERLTDPAAATEELLKLFEPGLDKMVRNLLRKRSYLFDPETAKGFAVVTALVDLADWDRSGPFLNWLEGKLEVRIEEVDQGLGLDWLDLQEQFHGRRLWDERTARYVRAVHQLPESARKIYLMVVVEEIPLHQAARLAGVSQEEVDRRARESCDLIARWVRLQEECDGK